MSETLILDDTPTPTYEPTLAVVFYESRERVPTATSAEVGLAASLAALHEIQKRPSGAPLLGPATFLSRAESKVLADLFAGANRATVSTRLYPEGLLCHDDFSATWFVPAARRPFRLRLEGDALETLTAVWPSLVLHTDGDRLYLAALQGSERPTLDTALFHAPLWNIWDSTQVCVGDARIPGGDPVDAIPGWNAIVFDTAFSHVNHPRTLAARTTSTRELRAYWSRRTRAATPPPARELRPLRKNLRQWLDGLREDRS